MPTNFWEFLHLHSDGIGILIFVFMVLLFFLITIFLDKRDSDVS